MNKPQQPESPRARLQALLAIPDAQRTEEQWDELNELEIMLAAGNRPGANQQQQKHGAPRTGGGPAPHGNPQGVPHGRKQSRKFHKRPPKHKGP